MIIKEKGNLFISVGNYSAEIPGTEVSVSTDAIKNYKIYEAELSWVKNDRIKTYLLIKRIKGENWDIGLNKVLDKTHLYDPDYRILIK